MSSASFRSPSSGACRDPADDPESPVVVRRRDSACWIRLNRPQALNAVTIEMLEGMMRALAASERDDKVRIVVVTGTGTAFCAGADLKDLGAGAEDDEAGDAVATHAAFVESLGTMLLRLEQFPKPVIAAVNGIAAAAGIEILLCCDFAIAAAGARIGDVHGKYGLVPGGGSSVRLPRRIGIGLAKYLMYTGELLPAEEFVGTDLVLRVVPGGEFEAAVNDLARKLAERSPLALRRMKRLIHDGMEMSWETALRNEREMSRIHAMSEDSREGLAAFARRRKPRFRGR